MVLKNAVKKCCQKMMFKNAVEHGAKKWCRKME